jgi:uncharacterized protein (TIGR02246 family)
MRSARRLGSILSVALAAGGLGPLARAQPPAATVSPAQEAAIEQAVRERSVEWSQAVLKRDASIFERIWAPDFVYVEPSGRQFTKAEGIADLKAGTDQVASTTSNSIDVRVYGGGTVAVDIGHYRETGRDKDGRSFDRHTKFTNVWVLHDGAWQCVSGHCSVVPPQP